MNQVLENIYARRSVRQFTEQAVSKQQLEALVGAGIHAPSGMNKQLWHFSAVQNQQLLSSLAKTVGEILGREGYDFYSPNALILVSNHRDNPHGEARLCLCFAKHLPGGTVFGSGLGLDKSVSRHLRRPKAPPPAIQSKGSGGSYHLGCGGNRLSPASL